MKIGFTGTQRGMSSRQKDVLRSLLNVAEKSELHHGDCIGADATAHDMAVGMGLDTEIHPPTNNSRRAFKKAARTNPPFAYLDRNKNIVRSTVMLIATPGEAEEQLRSGTWATVRFARKLKRRVIIILPDGTMKEEANGA